MITKERPKTGMYANVQEQFDQAADHRARLQVGEGRRGSRQHAVEHIDGGVWRRMARASPNSSGRGTWTSRGRRHLAQRRHAQPGARRVDLRDGDQRRRKGLGPAGPDAGDRCFGHRRRSHRTAARGVDGALRPRRRGPRRCRRRVDRGVPVRGGRARGADPFAIHQEVEQREGGTSEWRPSETGRYSGSRAALNVFARPRGRFVERRVAECPRRWRAPQICDFSESQSSCQWSSLEIEYCGKRPRRCSLGKELKLRGKAGFRNATRRG